MRRTLNQSRLTDMFVNNEQPVPNPEAKIEKLLKRLVHLYHEVLINFDREDERIKRDKVPEF